MGSILFRIKWAGAPLEVCCGRDRQRFTVAVARMCASLHRSHLRNTARVKDDLVPASQRHRLELVVATRRDHRARKRADNKCHRSRISTRIPKPASHLPARPEHRVRDDPNETTARISAKPSLPMPSYCLRYTIEPSESRKKCRRVNGRPIRVALVPSNPV